MNARALFFAGLAGLAAATVRADMREVLDSIRESEFRFSRAGSQVPMIPMAWVADTYYPGTVFKPENAALPSAKVIENTVGVGVVMPAYVGQRDLLLAGGDVGWDDVSVRSGPYRDQSVVRMTPVAAWLHQWNENDLSGVFAAPIFSKNQLGDSDWALNGYAGAIGMHGFSESLQLLYGGVYQSDFGQSVFYPYLGVQWQPDIRWSVTLVFPWPTITYVLSERWILQTMIAPGGSTWVGRGTGYETTQSLNSWNWTVNAGYRVYGKFWLSAGAGVAGLRGLAITSSDNRTRFEARPSPVFTLSVQFRP